MERKNILLLTMVISPTLGSEYSVAWNHVRFMSKYHNIHVLYEASSNILGDASEIKTFLNKNNLKNVTFHHVPPGKPGMFIYKVKSKFGKFVYSRYLLYIAFSLWHRTAYKYAKKLSMVQEFDVVHFLGPIGYREPGQLWKLNIPYIRGPVGGTYQRPISLFKAVSFKEKVVYRIRNVINWYQLRFSIGLRRSLKNTDVFLTTTTGVQSDFLKVHHKKSILLPENAISKIYGLNQEKFKTIYQKVELIIVGRIEGGKGQILLLEALARQGNKNFVLHVLGRDSNMSNRCKKFVTDNHLETNVIFHGVVPRSDVFKMMNESHLHVISSLSEAHTTVQWEAMSVGLPTLTLDHCGMGDVINENSGFKIPITTYEGTINAMAAILQEVLDNPQKLIKLGKTTIEEAKKFTWDNRVKFFNNLYSNI